MLDVFLTVDVEVWCDDWACLDDSFPGAFQRYVYGPTGRGPYGLPRQIRVLNEHDLKAVFFVESLFAARFGVAPLAEIVGLLQAGGQEVQLHVHPEWAQEALVPVVFPYPGRRSGMHQFTMAEQAALVAEAQRLMAAAGQSKIAAFRAGSFGFDTNTHEALAAHGIRVDCSYNAVMGGSGSGLCPGKLATQPFLAGPVYEYPMSVFQDGMGRTRHLQLTACSSPEMESVLLQAAERGDESVVILWHNFELLDPSQRLPDPVVDKRFSRLCQFLDRRRDMFNVRGFDGLAPVNVTEQPTLHHVGIAATARRMGEQLLRRRLA